MSDSERLKNIETRLKRMEAKLESLERVNNCKEPMRIVHCSFCGRPIEVPIDFEIPEGAMISCGRH